MAKGARSSRQKENKTKLRRKIFGPQERARTERLSAKLLELASRPKSVLNTTTMEIDTETASRSKSQEAGEATKLSEG
ncbi:hypothetical protein GcM1_250145 [Golovinomyces cichoracearum]|uniref:DUF2423 domain-containing protein n=1 Tax=Golovinomyces cichoracearum TaxID=62708 RepID=A0A420IAY2_9PEZI|nr:hypothetical protein GcM1_250145 [Golovinomyces cichoracearum]